MCSEMFIEESVYRTRRLRPGTWRCTVWIGTHDLLVFIIDDYQLIREYCHLLLLVQRTLDIYRAEYGIDNLNVILHRAAKWLTSGTNECRNQLILITVALTLTLIGNLLLELTEVMVPYKFAFWNKCPVQFFIYLHI